jgi:hypothetical protein
MALFVIEILTWPDKVVEGKQEMTISSVSSASIHSDSHVPTQSKPPEHSSPSQRQDSVELSAKAKASLGDVDHDGDSH